MTDMIIRVDDNGTLKTFNILDESIIAEDFDVTQAYAIGDYCFNGNTLYRFTSAHAAGAWNSSEVTAVAVCDELTSLKSDLGDKIPAPSSPSSGDFLVYNGSAWVAQSLSAWQGGSY